MPVCKDLTRKLKFLKINLNKLLTLKKISKLETKNTVC